MVDVASVACTYFTTTDDSNMENENVLERVRDDSDFDAEHDLLPEKNFLAASQGEGLVRRRSVPGRSSSNLHH